MTTEQELARSDALELGVPRGRAKRLVQWYVDESVGLPAGRAYVRSTAPHGLA